MVQDLVAELLVTVLLEMVAVVVMLDLVVGLVEEVAVVVLLLFSLTVETKLSLSVAAAVAVADHGTWEHPELEMVREVRLVLEFLVAHIQTILSIMLQLVVMVRTTRQMGAAVAVPVVVGNLKEVEEYMD